MHSGLAQFFQQLGQRFPGWQQGQLGQRLAQWQARGNPGNAPPARPVPPQLADLLARLRANRGG